MCPPHRSQSGGSPFRPFFPKFSAILLRVGPRSQEFFPPTTGHANDYCYHHCGGGSTGDADCEVVTMADKPKRREYDCTPEEFVVAWQKSASAQEAAERLKMPKPIVCARATTYRRADALCCQATTNS